MHGFLHEYDLGSCEWKVIRLRLEMLNFFTPTNKPFIYEDDCFMLIGGYMPNSDNGKLFPVVHFEGEIFVFGGRGDTLNELTSVEK